MKVFFPHASVSSLEHNVSPFLVGEGMSGPLRSAIKLPRLWWGLMVRTVEEPSVSEGLLLRLLERGVIRVMFEVGNSVFEFVARGLKREEGSASEVGVLVNEGGVGTCGGIPVKVVSGGLHKSALDIRNDRTISVPGNGGEALSWRLVDPLEKELMVINVEETGSLEAVSSNGPFREGMTEGHKSVRERLVVGVFRQG